MAIAKFKLIFNRKKEANLINPTLIEFEVYRNRGRKLFTTGIKVLLNQWDNSRREIIKHPNAVQLNSALRKSIDRMQRHDAEQYEKGIVVPLEFYKTFLKGSSDNQTFLEFFRNEFESNPSYRPNTKKNFNSAHGHLVKFGKLKYFSDLTYTNIQGFHRYLIALGLKDVTIQKYHKNIKTIIAEARRKGFIDKNENPYENFKMSVQHTKIQCLYRSEIKVLEELKFKPNQIGLEKARDMFLFSIYTGARFSDLCQVSNKTIFFQPEGIHLEYISVKTNTEFIGNLALFFKNTEGKSKPEKLVLKYKDLLQFSPFKCSLQPYNRKLKTIAKMANIRTKLTSHIARHTFATYMVSKIPLSILQKIMGHKSSKTTEQYLQINEQMMNEALDKVDWS